MTSKVTRIAAAVALLVPLIAGGATAAPPQHGPSVLVQLTRLQRGSLPRIITAFGRVETSAAARQTVMAPVSAVVGSIFVRPGEEIPANAPLIQLRPSPQTASAYAQAVAAVRAANAAVGHASSLFRLHLATRQDVANAERGASDAAASLAALKAVGADGPRILRAPFRAIVTAVATSSNAIVGQGAALLSLARPNRLVLRAGVVPEQAADIRPGDQAKVTPLGMRHPVGGKVLLRGAVVDPKTGLVPVEISVPSGPVFAGQMAKAAIVVGKVEGYIVPHEAVLVSDSGAPYVVQTIHRIARRVPVHVLLSGGSRDVVTGQLDPSGGLVLAGNYQLSDGMRVRVADPKAARTQ